MAAQDFAPSASTLMDLIAGHRVTEVIYVAAKLGIADLLAEGPKTAAELARLTDTHERSLLRLMRGLVTLGICVEHADSKIELTEMGNYLTAGSEPSLKAWALMEGTWQRSGWANLLESIRTGKTGLELAGGGPETFEEIGKSSEQAKVFNDGMVSLTSAMLPKLLAAYDFSDNGILLDVGGGFGQLMIAILRKYPAVRGIVFDLPHCAEGARKNLAVSGVADRCEFIAGSFFDSVPAGADAIIMKSIIHDWNDERCVRILQNCHRALKLGTRLMVVDRIVPDKLEPTADHRDITLTDLTMLRGPGGCERTESEHRELLAKGGFRMTRVVPAGRYSVIEAAVV
jgi:SAM-dependent methyltransferase